MCSLLYVPLYNLVDLNDIEILKCDVSHHLCSSILVRFSQTFTHRNRTLPGYINDYVGVINLDITTTKLYGLQIRTTICLTSILMKTLTKMNHYLPLSY